VPSVLEEISSSVLLHFAVITPTLIILAPWCLEGVVG